MSFTNVKPQNKNLKLGAPIFPAGFKLPPHHPFVAPIPQPIHAVMPVVVPPTFDSAPERAQVIAGVKLAIQNINDIIDVLNHPIANKGDIIDMDYSPEAVTTFRARSTECDHNLTGASVTASAWFTAVGTHLQEITNTLGQVQAQINTADQGIAKNTALIAANVKAIAELTQNMTHESQLLAQAQNNFNDAQRRFNDAKAEQDRVRTARNALIWIPFVAIALTVVDITKEQNDVNSTRTVVSADEVQLKKDRELVASHGAELKKLQQEGITLHATLVGLQAKESELKGQQSKLNADSEYLRPLKVNIDHCIHVVSAALGSGSTIDNLMSMNNVGVAIKGLVAALKNEGDFAGALAKLDEKGFAELDKRIQAIQKASKKSRLNV
ncbi:hypothetical protein FRB95_002900 [Tulasnella sp. JGI-2019a]|nr:hypothetical protein FRB95_002900 [Tulasnella sp. JGI-2019a]